ncbi:MAG: 6-bladed beta-propeller [Dysgonamonadaceae bacterium]|jgi:hypothetical protein|nr:6-bladed beta-propeller [Dysgonamonadaceae bacterium]
MKRILLYLSLTALCWNCTRDSNIAKYQTGRDHIVHVQEKIREIKIEDVLIGSWPLLYLMNNYLFISDYKSTDCQIHIFEKDTFNYVTGTAEAGRGPGEITRMGHIAIDEENHMFYVSDHGKQQIFGYDLDSVLAGPFYRPEVKASLNGEMFPEKYQYINDTLCIGVTIERLGNSQFNKIMAKWNMKTGTIQPMKYRHPDIERRRITFAVSVEHGIYVEGHSYCDLMSICSLDGELIYNIYGRNWKDRMSNRTSYYEKIVFCNDKIIALYSGQDTFSENMHEALPSKFLVFDIQGNYLQTIETGYRIVDFCHDRENNRLIMSLDDNIQFAYLELDGIV